MAKQQELRTVSPSILGCGIHKAAFLLSFQPQMAEKGQISKNALLSNYCLKLECLKLQRTARITALSVEFPFPNH